MRLRLIYLVMLLCVSVGAVAQNTSAQEERKARLEREIAIIDKQLAENASKSSTMLSDLSLIRKKVSNRKALVDESDKEIRRLNDNIYLTQRQINRIQTRVDTLTSHYARLVRSAYKNRDSQEMNRIRKFLYATGLWNSLSELDSLLAKWRSED